MKPSEYKGLKWDSGWNFKIILVDEDDILKKSADDKIHAKLHSMQRLNITATCTKNSAVPL